MSTELTLLVVSADPLARAALSALLESNASCTLLDVVDPAIIERATAQEGLESEADVIVWDPGLDAGPLPADYFADLGAPVVILLAEADQLPEAVAAGARGFIPRTMDSVKIVAAAQTAVAGLIAIDPTLLASLLPPPDSQPPDLAESMTPREMEVLQLLAEGLTNRAIASRLGVSEHTIKFHVNSILNKLDAQSRTEAVVTGTRLGLIAL